MGIRQHEFDILPHSGMSVQLIAEMESHIINAHLTLEVLETKHNSQLLYPNS